MREPRALPARVASLQRDCKRVLQAPFGIAACAYPAASPTLALQVRVHECAACGAVGGSKRKVSSADVIALKRCARCHSIYYCSEACQREHWPTHKPQCNRAPRQG